MWKQTILALSLLSSPLWANISTPTPALPVLTLSSSVSLTISRQNFLALERLLKQAEKQRRFSAELANLAETLIDVRYPLLPEAVTLLLNYQLNLPENQSFQAKQALIEQFSRTYPHIISLSDWHSVLFQTLYQQQRIEALIHFSQHYEPKTLEEQCRLLAARYQLFAEQWQPNPEAEQAGSHAVKDSSELMQLTSEFESLWLHNDTLPSDCHALQSFWQDQGLKTVDVVKQKAVMLFEKGAKQALQTLHLNSHGELNQWLNTVYQLLQNPKNLQNLDVSHPLDQPMQAIVNTAFGRYLNTLPEQLEQPNFSLYQDWAQRWGMSDADIDKWKIRFIRRFFDNADPIFQLWRDTQLKTLQEDSLTERRIRMAIWQQTELGEWLSRLSEEAKKKAEWRYWAAKQDAVGGKAVLRELAKERGFYSMLAAHALKQPYVLTFPSSEQLAAREHLQTQAQSLARVAELRQLGRLSQAKAAWVASLRPMTFEQQLAMAEYAMAQGWFDLTVESTIQAKAWDYVPLRLPNAYSAWFDAVLANKPIRKSFAMAIARQESAWNAQARSHANAIGLMQMLPSTAMETAKKSQLPYQREQDLLDPLHNILLGTTHLAELNEKYPNNRILIAAAYNAGASRVERWLTRAGGRLAMDEFIASIPFFETRGYVQNVLAYDYYYQMLYENPHNIFNAEEVRRY